MCKSLDKAATKHGGKLETISIDKNDKNVIYHDMKLSYAYDYLGSFDNIWKEKMPKALEAMIKSIICKEYVEILKNVEEDDKLTIKVYHPKDSNIAYIIKIKV